MAERDRERMKNEISGQEICVLVQFSSTVMCNNVIVCTVFYYIV